MIIDDARSFLQKTDTTYDLIAFGFLDSHRLFSHMSSVRLDNYVYTQESFTAATALVKQGGVIVVSAVTAVDWLRDRYSAMLERACGAPVQRQVFPSNAVYTCSPTRVDADPAAGRDRAEPRGVPGQH